MVEPDSECQVDRVAPVPSGIGEARWTRVPSGTSGRVGFGDGALTDAPTYGSGPDPSGWGPGSSDGTIRWVRVERRGGSEELTGSPGGYSGSLSRFRTCRSPASWARSHMSPWLSGHVGAIRARRSPTRPLRPGAAFPLPRTPSPQDPADASRPGWPPPARTAPRSVRSAPGC